MPKACPAFGRLCLFCKEKNHYAKMCPQKNPPVHMVDSSKHATSGGQVESEELFIGTTVNSNWIPELKPTYNHLVFTLNSGTNHIHKSNYIS